MMDYILVGISGSQAGSASSFEARKSHEAKVRFDGRHSAIQQFAHANESDIVHNCTGRATTDSIVHDLLRTIVICRLRKRLSAAAESLYGVRDVQDRMQRLLKRVLSQRGHRIGQISFTVAGFALEGNVDGFGVMSLNLIEYMIRGKNVAFGVPLNKGQLTPCIIEALQYEVRWLDALLIRIVIEFRYVSE